jgi:hypothetical protein
MRPHDLPILYHYSSVAGALAILKSGRIWLSTSAAMNDHAEGGWVPAALTDQVTGRPDVGVTQVFNALWQVAIAPYDRAYLTCLTEEGDLLSQWRAYAQDGEGIAIGFNANDGRLPVIDAPPHTNAGPDLELTLSKVSYPVDMSPITEALERAIAGGIGSPAFLEAQAFLIQERWRTKNPAFSEEREWRIINLPIEFDGDLGGGITTLSEVGTRQFREAGGRIVSYYEIAFSEEAVVELVLGPQCKVDEAELDMLLRDCGLKPQVRRSAATYRR